MSDLPDAGRMLEAAEQAVVADDLTSADELLRGAARVQEAELGPLNPDLANTLNNLGVVAEKTGRLGDAERFYRRAVAIASASLPADHPLIAASRQNLEGFCRASGLPIETPALTTPSEPLPPARRRNLRSLAILAIGGVVILMTAALLVRRPSRSLETSTPSPAAETAAPTQTTGKTPPTPEPAIPTPSRPSGAVNLTIAQPCRTFSTSSDVWRCDPVVDPVLPGPIVLYTRVRSPADAVVVHRWYRGDTLRQSVRLPVLANPTEGYRTYSRQTVDGGAEWRVEVRTTEGALLYERRFVVQ